MPLSIPTVRTTILPFLVGLFSDASFVGTVAAINRIQTLTILHKWKREKERANEYNGAIENGEGDRLSADCFVQVLSNYARHGLFTLKQCTNTVDTSRKPRSDCL